MKANLNVSNHTLDEASLNECLHKVISVNHPKDAINELLRYVGEKFECERTYIFERHDDGTFSNTYEWCKEGIIPQMDLLQREPVESIDWWWKAFEGDHPIMIKNLEDLKYSSPKVYAALKPQDIRSLVSAPIRLKDMLHGFIGVDNPDGDKIEAVTTFLFVIGRFASFLIDRREMYEKFEYLSDHDALTGTLNWRAYSNFREKWQPPTSIGAVYCEMTGLTKTNQTLGYAEGDRQIVEWAVRLRQIFSGEPIFRIGGDEFLIVSRDSTEIQFNNSVELLQKVMKEVSFEITFGSEWTQEEKKLEPVIFEAEARMHEKKSSRNRQNVSSDFESYFPKEWTQNDNEPVDLLASFIAKNHYDPAAFFRSIAQQNYYPYMGDLTKDLFYISDEMRDLFGFESNIVTNFLHEWKRRITNKEDLELFENDVKEIYATKRSKHDLKYRVQDKDGNDLWIHCHGDIQWNKDQTIPVFFSGKISRQEQNFIVDPVTNFPRDYAATMKLAELQKKKKSIRIIGFTLNNFSEINALRGREAGDIFLKSIARRLSRYFKDKIEFYRLDGMRFIAIILPQCTDDLEKLIYEVKEVIMNAYYGNNIVVKTPCSVGVLSHPDESASPHEILLNMINLLIEAKHHFEEDYIKHSHEDIHLQRTRTEMMMELSKNVIDGFQNFRVVIQPTVSTKDFRFYSGEMLMRWNFKGKDVPPPVFISIFESNGFILQAGKWVFEQAVKACKRIITFIPNFKLGVNVSYFQILDPDFLPFIELTLKKYDMSGSNLILEITETHYDETPTKVRDFILNCNNMGIDVAIDDFGDGYSSLAFLLKYRSNIVKLDKSIIDEMLLSKENIDFVSSIIYSCHVFKKRVCAEGVERQEEVEILKEAGCDLIQGYYFYKPMEMPDFYELLGQEQKKGQKNPELPKENSAQNHK